MKTTYEDAVRRLERMYNFRDVGGMPTTDGGTSKTGLLFRSGELSTLTARDLGALRGLDIRTICDLRSTRESRKKPLRLAAKHSVRVLNVPLHDEATTDGSHKKLVGFLLGKTGGDRFREFIGEFYHHLAFDRALCVGEAITLLAHEENLPAVIHCTAGKDRTGFLAAVIQLLVGVPYARVSEDYLRSNDHFEPRLKKLTQTLRIMTLFQVSPERMRLILTAHPEVLDGVHREIIESHGSIANYLIGACRVERETLENLKRLLLAKRLEPVPCEAGNEGRQDGSGTA
jgi:protein-tyrosine phosphatase